MNIAVKVVLGILILVLGYMLFQTIAEPIRWEKEKERRYSHVKTRLMSIRDGQAAYKAVHGKFASNFNDLLRTIKTKDLMVVKTIGNPDDSTVVVRRDTSYMSIMDSIYHGNMALVDSLPFVPFADGAKFEIAADVIRKGAVKIHVFEVRDGAPFDEEDVYQVGSLSEASSSGNWER